MTGPALPPPEPDRTATLALPPGGGRPIVVGAGFHSYGSRPHLSEKALTERSRGSRIPWRLATPGNYGDAAGDC
jgi:hypothetical protein